MSAVTNRSFKYCLLSLALAFMLALPVFADPVTPEQAREVVKGWLAKDSRPMEARLGNAVREVREYKGASGTADYYVVSLDPNGFVIVAADDLVEPIIAFSAEGDYVLSPDNPLAALVTADVPKRLGQVRALVEDAKRKGKKYMPEGRQSQARSKWNTLTDISSLSNFTLTGMSGITDVRVDPFLPSRWNQGNVCGMAVYNYYTPPGAEGSTGNYPAGCVATSMAQLMHYHQYPTAGVGTPSFTIAVCGVSQSRSLRGGNGSGGPYSWVNMPSIPDCSINLTQRQAIGALVHDAAVAAKMDFCSGGSGAYMSDAASALANVFQYSNVRRGANSNNNIGAGLNGMINPNMDARLPVILGIRNATSGHAVISDGYGYNASTMYHHLNMGWGGVSDAWYNLPNIDNTAGGTFDAVIECLYNVYTTGSGEIISGRVTDSAGNPISGASVTATRSSNTFGPVTTDSKGIYAIVKVPGGWPNAFNYTVSVTHPLYTFTSKTASVRTSSNGASTSGNAWGIDFTGTGGPAVTSFAVNNGAADTTSRNVTLNNTASGSPTHYMASESPSFSGAVWQTYSTAPAFTLSAGSGIKTVYFKVKNTYGTESAAVSDTINAVLDTTPPVTTANPAGGVYTSGQSVTLTANEPATIYYTTDGSLPTTGSAVYTSPIGINSDTVLRFFAVDAENNTESPAKQESYWILTAEGSIAEVKTLPDGSPVRLANKPMYLKRPGFGYITELERISGIRIEGGIPALQDDLVNLVGYLTTVNGERVISLTALTASGTAEVRPLGANNKTLLDSLMDGLFVTAWGTVKAGSVGANSFILSDGSDAAGIRVFTPGAPGVSEGAFVIISGAAGFDGSRLIHER